jgi:hypothetical protein
MASSAVAVNVAAAATDLLLLSAVASNTWFLTVLLLQKACFTNAYIFLLHLAGK